MGLCVDVKIFISRDMETRFMYVHILHRMEDWCSYFDSCLVDGRNLCNLNLWESAIIYFIALAKLHKKLNRSVVA